MKRLLFLLVKALFRKLRAHHSEAESLIEMTNRVYDRHMSNKRHNPPGDPPQ
jgi:hypothetical protein